MVSTFPRKSTPPEAEFAGGMTRLGDDGTSNPASPRSRARGSDGTAATLTQLTHLQFQRRFFKQEPRQCCDRRDDDQCCRKKRPRFVNEQVACALDKCLLDREGIHVDSIGQIRAESRQKILRQWMVRGGQY